MTEEEEIKAYRDEILAAQRAVEAACDEKDANHIKSSAEELMRIAGDATSYYYPGEFAEEFAAFRRIIDKVPEALRSAGLSAADLIIWVCRTGRPSGWMCSSLLFNTFVNAPSGEYAKQDVWREVAERLKEELKSFDEDQLDEAPSDGAHQLDLIYEAWKRAGDPQQALPLWIEYVPKIKNWKEVAKLLNNWAWYDEAIRIAREGIKACMSGDYPNDYEEEMMEPLADAFSGKGDHLKAAAILAEQFLSWIGAYEYHRSVESFNKILNEAELAGVKEETRTAIIHALKTGVNPEPLRDWKRAALPDYGSELYPGPRPVAYRAPDALTETPLWPLPKSNEGLELFDLRWDTTKWFCQQDQEFLLKLALAEGDKQEIIRRFEALPEFPNNNGFRMPDEKIAMLDAVAAAVGDIRPDIAELIKVRPNRYRKP